MIVDKGYEILHSQCTFNNNIQPIVINGDNSIVQHRFLSIKSTQAGAGQHSSTELPEDSEFLNFIEESSLSECGLANSNDITYQYCGICRYSCTNASNNQANRGSGYSNYQVGQITTISFSNFKGNTGVYYCLENWITHPYILNHLNILDNQINESLIISESSVQFEYCNIINNRYKIFIELYGDCNAIVNCFIDKLTTSGSPFDKIQTTNQEIQFPRCSQYKEFNHNIDENAETIDEVRPFFIECIITFYTVFTLS